MIPSSAYLLVFHGSRDPRTQSTASELGQLLTTKFQSKNILTQQNYIELNLSFSQPEMVTAFDSPKIPLIEVAPLELAPLSLNESLVKFALRAHQKGFKRIKVLPLFLAPGIHVQEDIPLEITLAIKQINNQVTIELSPYLGKYSGMVQLLSRKFRQLSGETRILMVHGSRSPQVNHYYQSLATQLNAIIAYWSGSPSLAQQVMAQIAAGRKKITILPYFLFPGRITRAIALEVAALQAKHPQVELVLGQPLGATEALAELIFKEV
ncbi:MAG: sirohydrochlorin chelatase [Pleurocapsa sp. MO_192.B19]|nr:sirohydrochlorin chelatase [Pleurocapsa sp. MO_192.B19]